MLHGYQKSNKWQFSSLWFDLTSDWTYDVPYIMCFSSILLYNNICCIVAAVIILIKDGNCLLSWEPAFTSVLVGSVLLIFLVFCVYWWVLLCVYCYNSYRINIYRFRAFWLNKSTATCLFLFVYNSMNFCVFDPFITR